MTSADADAPALRYSVRVTPDRRGLTLSREGEPEHFAGNVADLVFLLEQDLTVRIQQVRSDLLFLHAAALEWRGGVYLLVAKSGTGKSTLAWALLHAGLGYLSDELAPVDLATSEVVPYPRALCLKQVPAGYPLPAGSLDLGATLHIPARLLPADTIRKPRQLCALLVLTRPREAGAPGVRQLGTAEAAARLYPHVLNALAHENRGLDAVMQIASHAPCYMLTVGELSATSALIRATMGRVAARGKGAPGSAIEIDAPR